MFLCALIRRRCNLYWGSIQNLPLGVLLFVLTLGYMDCPPWFIPNRSPSTTTSISNVPSSLPVPTCAAAVSLCMAYTDKLLQSVIFLSIIVGILLTLSSILLFLLCLRPRHGWGRPIPAKDGTRAAGSTLKRPGQPDPPDPLSTSNVSKNEESTVLPPPESGPPPPPKPQLEVQDETQGSHALARTPQVASVHASSEDDQPRCPSVQPDVSAHSSTHQPSPAPSISAVSIDDFDQGQDVEFHPEVRALVEEGKFTKDAARNMKPVVPKAGTVIPDYNPILDEIRPKKIDDYIRKYRIFFIIDDSSSMTSRWNETRDALLEIADHALKYHSDTIDIRFFNSGYLRRGVQGKSDANVIFNSVSPSRGTPTGRVLKEVLDEQLNRLDNAIREGKYSSERPLDIIVLTDGVPDSDSRPAPVIKEAAKRLKAKKHHSNWIGIQFVQIGDHKKAEAALLSLIDAEDNNHMVDTVSYGFYKDEGGGRLTPQILERIILGGLHPNLRSYYNQFCQKVKQKSSKMI